jgi:hypothetical protein
MRAILNSLGMTLWWSTAIILAAGLAMVGYRGLLSSRSLDTLIDAGPQALPAGEAPALRAANPDARSMPSRRPLPDLSAPHRTAAPVDQEIAAAAADLRAHRWQEALDRLNAVDQRQAVLDLDRKTLYQYRAIAKYRLGELSGAQADFERVIASAAATDDERRSAQRSVDAISRDAGQPAIAQDDREPTTFTDPHEPLESRDENTTGPEANRIGSAAAESSSPRQADSRKISAVIGKEMKTAQDALQKGQWQEALKNLDAASQKSGINAFDKYKIEGFRFYADVKLQHFKEAQADLEAELASGQESPEDTAKNTKILFQLAAQNQNYPKAIEVGKQLADQGQLSPNDLTIVAQLYYVQKDCKDAVTWADRSIAAYQEAQEKPRETPYQFKLQCASDAGDMASMESPLIELVRLTNKTTYWNDLLRIERLGERDDRNLLMIYRIMYNTQSMKEGSDYIEMAMLLCDAGLAGEGLAVLNKALAAGLIKPEQQDRMRRLAEKRADSEEKDLAQREVDAAQSSSGGLSIRLGLTYYGMADYQSAAESIQQGLRKGDFTRPDEAYVYLGLADAHLGDIQGAKESFARLERLPMSPRVLKLWQLYSSTLDRTDASTLHAADSPPGNVGTSQGTL